MMLPVVVATVLSVRSSFPHGGAACKTDWDCSLGGICVNSLCNCDPWFTGANCTFLNLVDADTDWGFQVPASYSWGGHASYDTSSKKWFGFFAFMEDHCSLQEWTTNSAIVMASSDKSEGPFDTTSYKIINKPWAHNPFLVQDPVSEDWLLWHIGDGTSPKPPKNCSGAKPPSAVPASTPPVASKLFVDTATNLPGPWKSEWYILMEESWTQDVSNPSPFLFKNGTAMLYFSTANCPPGWGKAPRCISQARSTTGWQGPYTVIGTEPIVKPESEDPMVWRDHRGNFHLFTNVNTYHKRCLSGVPCGGHSWSRDGISWSTQFIGAFGPVIHLSNGTVWNNSYIERPQVVQNDDGTPLTFYTGLGRTTYYDSISWAQPFCTQELLEQGRCAPTVPL
eukprot:TRINITY_DN16538_c0_g1_i1.p1 TRINITY_DN16538_c0_g1~~TRINITY_DN16538_c0_g1_i1.p1  ORF type:complete len:411 (+),score=44.06 TRINITY_DN16538_c0_g1_i1:54-1235(+)